MSSGDDRIIVLSSNFVNSLYGWAVGNSGTIIRTSDGEDSWIVQDNRCLLFK